MCSPRCRCPNSWAFCPKIHVISVAGGAAASYSMLFWPLRCESEAICLKSFVPVTRAVVFIWENCYLGYRGLGCKKVDLGTCTRASPVSPMNTSTIHIDIFTKERVARRDLGNPSQPGWPRAHMKRPPITNDEFEKLFSTRKPWRRYLRPVSPLYGYFWVCQISFDPEYSSAIIRGYSFRGIVIQESHK